MFRVSSAGSFQNNDLVDHLAFFYGFICWIAHSRTGVRLAKPYHPRVIADMVRADKRNVYLSRLEGCLSTSCIIGPAIGGILGQISNQFPMYAAAVISGIAMLAAFVFLKESNPLIVDAEGNYRPKRLVCGFVSSLSS